MTRDGRDATAQTTPRWLVLLLGAYTALVVFTTDVYMPVLPRLEQDFATNAAVAAATLSAVLVGIAGGQVVLGPVSDAVGRRLPLLVGGIAYSVAHVLSAFAPTIEVLLLLRFVTGLAAATCLVVTRAIVADVYPGAAAGRAFATLGAVGSVAPVIAPLLGGLLARVMDWRGMFLVLAGAAVLLVALGARALPETLPRERRIPPRFGPIVSELGAVLAMRPFLAYLAAASAVGAVLFGYIGASSFVLQEGYGLSPQQYSLVFAMNAVGIVAASLTTRQLVSRMGSVRLLALGHTASAAGAGILGLGVGLHSLVVLMVGLFVAIASIGFVIPSVTTLAMAVARNNAGAASGLLGICQFTFGALASPLAGAGGSAWSLVAVVAAGALAGPLLMVMIHRPRSVRSLRDGESSEG
ncbi:multidrug effflux MFS transporter [Demequina capsici]|uniref:Multidrug effflux MFS transporter n=1 Tax=Demequina capsici TaxID=3075620 RepID=A0AA96JH09_9MICO|nr:multidrug effflux MFS transporter [Demequina sp. PMTSA13]WNM28544.1 multidrug effflux MFS transporter [Demequina sp. PMTSA13]